MFTNEELNLLREIVTFAVMGASINLSTQERDQALALIRKMKTMQLNPPWWEQR